MANYDWRILSGNSLDGFRRFHEKAPETSLIPRLHFFLPGFPFTPFPFCVPLFCRCIVCCFLCRALSICSLDFSSFPRGLKLFPATPFLLAEYLLPLLPKAGKRITKTKICIKTIAPSTRNSLGYHTNEEQPEMQFRLCPENSVAQNDGSSEQCVCLEEKEKKNSRSLWGRFYLSCLFYIPVSLHSPHDLRIRERPSCVYVTSPGS